MRLIILFISSVLLSTGIHAQPYADTLQKVAIIDNEGIGTAGAWGAHTIFNKLIFAGTTSATGMEWYQFDGTNPPQVVETAPGSTSGVVGNSVVVNNAVYYLGNTTAHGREIYKWDGSSAPSVAVDLYPGAQSSKSANLFGISNNLYYTGDSFNIDKSTYIFEYYTVSKKSAIVFTDPAGGQIGPIAVFHNRLYFNTDNKMKEYNPQTKQVKDITGFTNFGSPIQYGTRLYFVNGARLYEFDSAVVNMLATNYNVVNPNTYPAILPHNGIIYFWAHIVTQPNNVGLYMYDTATGAVQLSNAPLVDGGTASSIRFAGVYGNDIYFARNYMLMRYNGTTIDSIGPANTFTGQIIIYKGSPYISARIIPESIHKVATWDNKTAAGIYKLPPMPKISLYPNPATNEATVNISLQDPLTLNAIVTDISGRKVYATKPTLFSAGTSTIQLPLHNMPAGNYVVTLNNSNGTPLWSSKILKQ